MNRLPLSAPDVGDAERAAVDRAMRSGWIAPLGPEVDAFEAETARRCGARRAVATSSGTAALHLALLGAGAAQGTAVVTSTFTFAATLNAIAYTGADPVVVDVDPTTGNLDVDLVRLALDDLSARGIPCSAVLPVDIYGKAADYTTLSALGREHGVPIVADGAEAVGATHDGRPVGSLARVTAVSFNGNKIMTTSGGGMLLTDDDELADAARRLATQARQPVAHYEHAEVGFNYRLSNVLAAIGRVQLSRLDSMIARRRQIRDRYREILAPFGGVRVLGGDDDASDNCWLTSIVVDDPSSTSVAEMTRVFESHDIETRRLWKPMHRQPAFSTVTSYVTGAADRLFASGLTLPSGSGMSDEQIDRVARVLEQALRAGRARG